MPTEPNQAAAPSIPAFFGRYQVLEELGTGGMGTVYLCVDPRLARPVAIKVLKESHQLPADERERLRARFRQEAEAAGRLNHPHIVQIYDIGPTFIVMEFLEGWSLAALIRSGGSLTVKQVASVVLRVADAVDYAHRHGVIHRDIKPANIMLLSDGGVKVLDFGVARLDSSHLTAAGTVVGSVRYMAPEQMMGRPIDGRADIFSLAAVAYELLTAKSPFGGKSVTEVVYQVVHGGHVPPCEADPRLPRALDPTFARAFASNPEDRYQRAMDFARDLQTAAQPVQDLDFTDAPDTSIELPWKALKSLAPLHPAILNARTNAPREAVLLLDSDPAGATVYLDGNPVGKTPLPALEVSYGRHVVRMEIAGREPVSAELDLPRDRGLKALTFSLPDGGAGEGKVSPGQYVPFGPDVTPPRRIGGAVPAYPEAARERGLVGAPVVELWVSDTGDVIDVAIVESAGAVLDSALLEAVTTWRFTPATLRGVPVCVRMQVQHHFSR